MQHIFISYKHDDLDFAANVITTLEKAGYATWTDLKIGAGEEWRTAIDLAIKNAFALVVIMTPEAKASEYVTYEWAFAWGVGIRVIPILLKPTQLHPRLEALQFLDFTNIKSRPWERLIEEVRAASCAPLSYSVSIPLNSPPFIRQAVAALDSAVLSHRSSAVETLATARTPACRTVLREALTHPLPDVRINAAQALGLIRDSAAVPGLIEMLADPVADMRSVVALALGKIGGSAVLPALIEALSEPEESVRAAVVNALGWTEDPAVVPFLTAALEDPYEVVCRAAVEALRHIRDSAALVALNDAVEHRYTYVRSAAVEALDPIKEPVAPAENSQ